MSNLQQTSTEWGPWINEVCESVGVDADEVDVAEVHGLTQVVARDFLRPMAPVSAYIWGLARAQHPDADPATLRDAILSALPTEGTHA